MAGLEINIPPVWTVQKPKWNVHGAEQGLSPRRDSSFIREREEELLSARPQGDPVVQDELSSGRKSTVILSRETPTWL